MFGQFVIKENEYWIGRKNIPQNWLTTNEIREKIKKAIDEKKESVHISIFLRDKIKNPTAFQGDLILDFDSKNVTKAKEEVTPLINELISQKVPFVLTYSGNRGFKIIVQQKTIAVQNCTELPFIYKNIALKLQKEFNLKSLDTGIYNAMHLNRVINTIHEKTGLFAVPITIKQFFSMNEKEIKKYAETQHFIEIPKATYSRFMHSLVTIPGRKQKTKTKQSKITNIPLCIQEMLKTPAKEGNRHNTALRIASYLYRAGKENVLQIMLNWNNLNKPPLPEKEIEYLVQYLKEKQYKFSCSDEIISNFCPFLKKSKCPFYKK